jgi:hypothetical protein
MHLLQVPAPPVPPPLPQLPSPEVIIGGGPSPEQLLVALGGVAVIIGMIVLGPVGRAIADGLRHAFGVRRGADPAELGALREEIAALRHQVAELEERQDFAERLLAQARERGLLSGPATKE